MKKKIFGSICLAALLSLLVTFLALSGLMYREIYQIMEEDLLNEAKYLASGIEGEGIEYLNRLEEYGAYHRFTWIDADGTVLYDNMADALNMDNHAERPEVNEAMKNGVGQNVRQSDTIGTQIFYYAVRMEDGTVFRVSKIIESVWGMLGSYLPIALLISALVAAGALLVARGLSRRIVVPINSLNLEDPLSQEVYEEISPLMLRIARQNASIESGMHALKARQEEFTAITENMSEGLIVLDSLGHILTINGMARKIYHINDNDGLYQDILTVDRSEAMQQVVNEALSGKNGEDLITQDGRQYQIFSNPVIVGDVLKGAVLLLWDVTERQEAERMRREFTANVSHELKTPLQSISGYAELMKNGMVRAEDVPGFAGRIHQESRRLIHLVTDIIQISHLDEGTSFAAPEPVELKALAAEVAGRLLDKAYEAGLTIEVTGVPAKIMGVRSILDEMIYNLCDNAIKYNRKDGKVEICIKREADAVCISVADTGIGIPEDSQSRVFERFYRVDKSRSKSTGGTGLGLSIVKHGAIFHRAEIKLYSKLGAGTRIIIRFPAESIIN